MHRSIIKITFVQALCEVCVLYLPICRVRTMHSHFRIQTIYSAHTFGSPAQVSKAHDNKSTQHSFLNTQNVCTSKRQTIFDHIIQQPCFRLINRNGTENTATTKPITINRHSNCHFDRLICATTTFRQSMCGEWSHVRHYWIIHTDRQFDGFEFCFECVFVSIDFLTQIISFERSSLLNC